MRGAMRLSALSHAGVIYGTDSLLWREIVGVLFSSTSQTTCVERCTWELSCVLEWSLVWAVMRGCWWCMLVLPFQSLFWVCSSHGMQQVKLSPPLLYIDAW
jgi:hypothetical protein